MTRPRSCYDILQVSANATPEVIEAAYRALCRGFHPDLHAGDVAKAEVMAVITTCYEVLRDPAARQAHDKWLADRRQETAQNTHQSSQHSTTFKGAQGPTQVRGHLRRFGMGYALLGLLGIAIFLSSEPGPSGLPPYNASPLDSGNEPPPWTLDPIATETTASTETADVAKDPVSFATAPNGEAWPATADYVAGYPQLRRGGLSSVTVDNSSNSSDKFVKLVYIGDAETLPVRQFFIPAGQMFTVEGVLPGQYDVRYMDLETGGLSRSEAFDLEEIEGPTGTQYSTTTLTLYSVANGNLQTYPLDPNEF